MIPQESTGASSNPGSDKHCSPGIAAMPTTRVRSAVASAIMLAAHLDRSFMAATTAAGIAQATSHLRGIVLMLAAGFVFVIMDATGKHLTSSLSVSEITWGRCLFHML